MSKRNKNTSVCREDKRTQWEKERDERVEKTIHRNRSPIPSLEQMIAACNCSDVKRGR